MRVLACAALVLMPAAAVRAEIIDRVLAVVDGALITQSDVLRAVRLGLVAVPETRDPVPGTLDALIERRLMLAEVERYAPPDPVEARVEQAFEALRARVGAPELEAALLETGGASISSASSCATTSASRPISSSASAASSRPSQRSRSITASTRRSSGSKACGKLTTRS